MGQDKPASHSNALWGGRFSGSSDQLMQEINASIHVDKRFFDEDIDGSVAHVTMLGAAGILLPDDVTQIRAGLEQVRDEIRKGDFEFTLEREDIHMHVEARLAEIIGPVAGKLHTARSRNDQVATDFRLWLRSALDALVGQVRELQSALVARAAEHTQTILPGLTHLQNAQPVTFGHHLLAWVEMLDRDAGRLTDARTRLNECPLGAAALAGTAFPIDRHMTAGALGFDRPMANSMDAVSARDFALEALSAFSICATHLSRMAEELVFWASTNIGFIAFSDKFSTGSSIMPQKRNPDAAELLRAKVGQVFGAYTQMTLVLKGLPLAYSKDMQEDKEPVFAACDNLALCLSVMAGMATDMRVNKDRMRAACEGGFLTATDLADWLVRCAGRTFREAHHITGQVVRMAETKGKDIAELSLSDLQTVDTAITEDVFAVLDVESSVMSRISYGGPSPLRVEEQIKAWKERLG